LIINISAGLILQKGFKVNENFEADNNFHNGAITPGIAIKNDDLACRVCKGFAFSQHLQEFC
jgi:hypothetical protein